MTKPILTFLLFHFLISALAQEVQPILSIKPYYTSDSDLVFLKDELKNVEIISLGEQTHYDGATFDAKVRLIKYLHNELGFNTIAFESGFFDCYKANLDIKNRKEGDSTNYLNQAIFGVWNNKQVYRLAQFIDSTYYTDSPLNLVGFDLQSSGFYSRKYLADDLKDYIKYLELRTNQKIDLDTVQLDSSINILTKYSNHFKKIPEPDTTCLFNASNQVLDIVHTLDSKSKLDSFWIKNLKLIQFDYRKRYSSNKAFRDSIMASNIIWLKNNSKDKIILWAANTHISKNTETVKLKYLRVNKQMGAFLKENFQSKYYALGFTSFGGRFFDSWFFNSIFTKKPKSKSIERYLQKFNYQYCYLKLSNFNTSQQTQSSKIYGNRPLKMNVEKCLDGLFYIENMYPANY